MSNSTRAQVITGLDLSSIFNTSSESKLNNGNPHIVSFVKISIVSNVYCKLEVVSEARMGEY